MPAASTRTSRACWTSRADYQHAYTALVRDITDRDELWETGHRATGLPQDRDGSGCGRDEGQEPLLTQEEELGSDTLGREGHERTADEACPAHREHNGISSGGRAGSMGAD